MKNTIVKTPTASTQATKTATKARGSRAAQANPAKPQETPAQVPIELGRDTFEGQAQDVVRTVYRCWFQAPQWMLARLGPMRPEQIVTSWLRNGRWLDDPIHGEFTKARFRRKWALVMEDSEHRKDRDESDVACENLGMTLQWETFQELECVEYFLGESKEVILLGILARECLAPTSPGPCWDDMTMIQVAQSRGGAA